MEMANICEKCNHKHICGFQDDETLACNHFQKEVVRCKDCKYINREIRAKGYGCLCDAHSCDREGHERYLYVEDDDFCSYGERREGE